MATFWVYILKYIVFAYKQLIIRRKVQQILKYMLVLFDWADSDHVTTEPQPSVT